MSGELIIGTKLETKSFDAQIKQLENKLEMLEKSADESKIPEKFRRSANEAKELNAEIEKTKNKLLDLRKKQNQNTKEIGVSKYNLIKEKIDGISKSIKNMSKIDLKNVTKRIDNIGKSINGVIKKVVKWGLAIFGIRAAYNLIRQSVSTISEYNEGLGNQIKLMKNTIATALEPVIKYLISLVYTLFSFINSIIKSLTGKDLFATAAKNMKSGAGSAKEINRQLAGFDEMDVLSKNSSSGAGGGFNTKGFVKENTKLLKILNNFKKMFKEGDWAGIGRYISDGIVSGLNGLVEKIKSINWKGIGTGISDFLNNINYSGILVNLARVFGEAIMGFQEMFLNIKWGNIFKKFSKGLSDAIYKIDDYIRSIKWKEIANKVSEIVTSIEWGELGSSILTTIWDAMSGLLTLILGLDWDQIARTVSDSFKTWIDTILKKFKETNWEEAGEKIANDIANFIENFDWIGVGKKILEAVIRGMTAIEEVIVGEINGLTTRIMDKLGLDEKAQEVGKNISTNIAKGISSVLPNVATGIASLPAKVGSSIGNKAANAIKKIFGAKGMIYTPPKLALGGIINQPGTGVPIGSAYGGERGMEGVIPLTDSQQMALLGEAIGRYINVNLTNVTELDGRTIARKVEQINNNNNFVLNR